MTKNEILNSIELRQSTIKDFLNCPLMFRFKHLEQIPENFRHSAALHGIALHKIIHRLHIEDWDLPLKEAYIEALNDAIEESNIEIRWKETQEKYLENALEILNGYKANPINRTFEILYSEVKFRVKIHGHLFTGTIDQVRRDNKGKLELLDLKSAKQRPNNSFLLNDWQLRLYSYALAYGEVQQANGLWVKPQIFVDYASWYFLRAHEIRKRTTVNGKVGEEKGIPLYRTDRSLEDLKLFKMELKYLLNSMLRDWHYCRPDFCVMCHYTHYCKNRGEAAYDLSEEEREQIKDIN